jgi:hypothetical protein
VLPAKPFSPSFDITKVPGMEEDGQWG